MALRAGAEVFAADGLHAATMDEVARRAGYAKPILYRFYPSKDALFHAVFEAECENLVQHLFAAYARSAGLPMLEQFREGTSAFVEYAKKNPDGFRLVFQTSQHRSSTVASKRDVTAQRVIDRVADSYRRELKAKGVPHRQVADMYATMVVGLNAAIVERLLREPSWDEAAVINLVAEFLNATVGKVSRETLEMADVPRATEKVKRVRAS
jgi:AcrR family transcriptional regulator